MRRAVLALAVSVSVAGLPDRAAAQLAGVGFHELERRVEEQTRGSDYRFFLRLPYAGDGDPTALVHQGAIAMSICLLGVRKEDLALRSTLQVDDLRLYFDLLGEIGGTELTGVNSHAYAVGLGLRYTDLVYLRASIGQTVEPGSDRVDLLVHAGIPRLGAYAEVTGGTEALASHLALTLRAYSDLYFSEDTARSLRLLGIHELDAEYDRFADTTAIHYRVEDFLGGYLNGTVDHTSSMGVETTSLTGTLSLFSYTRWLSSLPLDAPSHGIFPLHFFGIRTYGSLETRVPSLAGQEGFNFQLSAGGGATRNGDHPFRPSVHGGVVFASYAGGPGQAIEAYGLEGRVEYVPETPNGETAVLSARVLVSMQM